MEYLIYILPSETSPPDLWTIGTAISSTIIALIAVVFTWRQSRKTDRHNRLMVTPHLATLTTINNEDKTLLVKIENNGIGPAIIKDFAIHVDNKLIEGPNEVEESLNILFKDLPISKLGHEAITRESFLPAGKNIELATIVTDDILPEEIAKKVDPRINIVIQYQSIYGDKYEFNSDD